jgi:hypothetical protein
VLLRAESERREALWDHGVGGYPVGSGHRALASSKSEPEPSVDELRRAIAAVDALAGAFSERSPAKR